MSDTPATAPAPAPSAPLPVRSFTEDGLAEVADLLKTIRADGQLHRKEVEDLLVDPQFAKPISGSYTIDPARVFATKLDLCQYFTALFDDAFLEAHRKDAGLWTWLALAYYPQFVKTKGGVAKLAANDCWIYSPDSNRSARRHFVAAPIYLYLDISIRDDRVENMIFSRPPTEFNKLLDYLTNVSDSIRTPAYLVAAATLYYDPNSAGKYKKGCLSLTTKGNVFQYTRVLQQLRETFDFSTSNDVPVLLRKLPSQFDSFKSEMV